MSSFIHQSTPLPPLPPHPPGPLRSENSDQLLSQQIPMILPPASSTPPTPQPPPPPPFCRLNRGWGGKGIGAHWTATAGQWIESHLTILLAPPLPHQLGLQGYLCARSETARSGECCWLAQRDMAGRATRWGLPIGCMRGGRRTGPGNAVAWRKGAWRDGWGDILSCDKSAINFFNTLMSPLRPPFRTICSSLDKPQVN